MADPVTLMMIANIALTATMYAVTASQTIKGPRLSKDDQKVTLGDPGAPIVRVWGTRWVTATRIAAADLHETKKKTKGKGGKYQEYKYDGSWLDHFTDTPVDAVTKMKMDGRLVYQRTGVGPVSSASVFALIVGTAGVPGAPVKLQQGTNFALYTGQQTAPDPWYAQFTEDETGLTGMAPAFLGETYAKFHRIPLEKFGNRLPNVEAELVRNKSDAFLMESIPQLTVANGQFTPDRRFFYSPGPGPSQYSVFDVAKRTWILQGVSTSIGSYSVGPGGIRYGVNGFFDPEVVQQSMTGGESILYDDSVLGGTFLSESWHEGQTLWFRDAGGSHNLYFVGSDLVAIPLGFSPTWVASDLNGDVWAAGLNGGNIGFECIQGSAIGTFFAFAALTTGDVFFFANEAGNFFAWQNGTAYLVDPVAGTLLDTAAIAGGDSPQAAFREIPAGARSIWLQFAEWNANDLSLVRTVSVASWTGIFSTQGVVYSRVLDALFVKSLFVDETKILYLDRASPNGVDLGDVIADVCAWSGIPADAIDVSACTQPVLGFSVQQQTGRAMLDPLLKIFDTIARPTDFSIEFKPRGDAPVGTLPMRRFVKGGKRYDLRRSQGNELPLDVTVVFSDRTKEDQRNTAIADQAPEATGSDRRETIDLNTFSDTPDGAQQKGDRYLRRLYNSKERLENTVSVLDVAFEPGDVVTITVDRPKSSITLNMLLDEQTHRGGVSIDCKWSRDEAAVAVLNPATVGAPTSAITEQTIYVPAFTQGFEIDGPLFRDADNDPNPRLYAAAGAFGSPWPGAAAWRATSLGVYDELNATFDSSQGSLFGVTTTALGAADPGLWDLGNTLDVTIFGGTLTNHTTDECDADPLLNLLALGKPGRWEYLQFTSATLVSTSGSSRKYVLQGFKRGRRGTEGNVGNHVSGDDVLVYNAGDVVVLEFGADEIGNDMSFKTASLGMDPDSAAPVDFTFAGNTLKPYSPCSFVATYDASTGDWLFTWIRRTRIGGAWSSSGGAIPLGEANENYELEIPTSGSPRVISATSETATWTSAQQSADYGAPQTSLPAGIAVYQLGDLVGRGFASEEPTLAGMA